ncbi:hypothetical protein Ga0080559_TMP1443 [Salipiger profundus]|uniref:Uncharacterized protein n=1 Tax=Salipiger profundus TaxID=1229727 RepID=A0A1U7D263_9RHOB|nr:hypothetical protein Ga0080559_TMP1443 [Salipiger profundus]
MPAFQAVPEFRAGGPRDCRPPRESPGPNRPGAPVRSSDHPHLRADGT